MTTFGSARAPLAIALLIAGVLSAGTPARAGDQLPFKELLMLVDVSDGVATYVGTATHLGQVLVYWDLSTGEYEKFGANGDSIYGYAYPDNAVGTPPSGPVFVTGGTGRFDGATGESRYWAVEVDPDTGLPAIGYIEGYLSRVGSGQ